MGHSGRTWENGRQRALQRDNYQCQDCGAKDESVHAHHIRRPEEFDSDEAAHHESNLVALCRYCHPSWEDIDGRPILLTDDGVNLEGVVNRLVYDTVRRVGMANLNGLHGKFIRQDGEVCDQCFRRVPRASGRTPKKPVEQFDEGVASVVVDGEIRGGFRQRQAPSILCRTCKGRTKELRSVKELIAAMHNIVDRAEDADIPIDLDVAYETVRESRRSSGPQLNDIEVLGRASGNAIRTAIDKRGLRV